MKFIPIKHLLQKRGWAREYPSVVGERHLITVEELEDFGQECAQEGARKAFDDLNRTGGGNNNPPFRIQ